MTVREEAWPPGVPSWVDLMVPDRHVAKDFYTALFGWDYDEGSAETGYYSTCLVDGQPVAGIGQSPPEQSFPPPAWTTYLATDSADDAAAAVTSAGGQIVMPALDVMQFGRMAIAVDPAGAVFGLWQSGSHTGANLVNEPGALIWNEVLSRDVEASKPFYASVFGWTYTDMGDQGFTYASIELDGRTIGGIGGIPPYVPEGAPSHWLTYFATADTDAACAAAGANGGVVHREPVDTEYGRMAVVGGPAGETFALMSATG